MGPKVSVIIPTYNRSVLLQRALASVAQQSYASYEVIVVDDYSSESILDVCTAFSATYVLSEGKGVSAARNTGIKKATGDFIAFLDSDDEWLPAKNTLQVEFLLQNMQLSLVHCNEQWLNNGNVVKQLAKHKKFGGRVFDKCIEQCIIGASCTMIRRESLVRFGYFDETFPTCEDYDLWLRISAQENIGFIEDELTIKHAGHNDQLSLQYHSMDLWRVRALIKHLNSHHVSTNEHIQLVDTIKKKAHFVLNGARKHGNTPVILELENILQTL